MCFRSDAKRLKDEMIPQDMVKMKMRTEQALQFDALLSDEIGKYPLF
jgi:hypothetical protein